MNKDSKREKKNIFELIEEMCPDGVEYRRLGDVAVFYDGYPFKKKQFGDDGIPIIRTTNLQDGMIDISTAMKCADYDASLKKYRIQYGDVLIGMSGTIKIARNLTHEKMLLNQRVGIFRGSNVLNNNYLYHYLCAHIDDLYDMCSGGTVVNLSKKALLDIEIPVPPLAVQQEVVRVLDTMTELTAELTAKLNAELTAREKQYAYYRDLLLSFLSAQHSHF